MGLSSCYANVAINHMVFDTDSCPILIDSGASRCMTNCKDDFVDTPLVTKHCIQGLGNATAMMTGTVRYASQVSHFLVKDCLYVPTLPIYILSPQHWAQNHPGHHAESRTTATHVILEWDDSIRHIPLTSANVGELQSAPGYSTLRTVLRGLSSIFPDVPCCFPAHIIPPDDDEAKCAPPTPPIPTPNPTPTPSRVLHLTNGLPPDFSQGSPNVEPPSSLAHNNNTTDQGHRIFDLTDLLLVQEGESMQLDQVYSSDPTSTLLHWHYRLGHVSFKVLQSMAKQGILDKCLAKCKVPRCTACMFSRATRRPWRMRAQPNAINPAMITGPGDCVSMNQIKSSIPGLIAQL